MSNEIELYRGLQAMLDGLSDGAVVEFEIISENRARYMDLMFQFDIVVGYAKDLRLIEFRTEDTYGYGSHKIIYIYPYGTHPKGTVGIVRREPGEPDGGDARFFSGMPVPVFRSSKIGDTSREDNPGRSGNYLSSGKS